MDQENDIIPTLHLKVIKHNGKPAIEVRKVFTDLEAIKTLVSAAYHDQQLMMQPNFTNRALAVNRLIEVGLVHVENGEYRYLF